MKKQFLSLVFLLSLPSLTFAYTSQPNTESGAYIGIQLGNTFPSNCDSCCVHTKKQGLLERFYAGIDFNRNIGLELGYTNYPEYKYTFMDVDGKVSRDAFDLLAKVTFPVYKNFSVIAKFGLTENRVEGDSITVIDDYDDHTGTIKRYREKHRERDFAIQPMAGIGVSYAVTPKVNLDLSYLNTVDCCNKGFYAFGLTYHFK